MPNEVPQANGHSVLADFRHPMEVEEFRKRGKEMIDLICDYYAKDLEERPVRSQVEIGYLRNQQAPEAPETGQELAEVLQDVQSQILPGVSHWQSPSFFAYYPANMSFPSLLGDMLSGALNMIGFSWISSPACTELETIVLDWLAKLLALPPAFLSRAADGREAVGGGVIQGTASEATVVALLAARTRALKGRPAQDACRLVVYTSDQAHSCAKKACMIANVMHCRILPTSGKHDWALQPDVLEAAVEADKAAGLLPCMLMATLGTTSSCAMDPLDLLGDVAARQGMWLHVDAAYAGVAAICPELREPFRGLEKADSFCTNAHKWLLVNFDCSCMWVRDAGPLKDALSLTPEYLRAKGNHLDFKDWQIPLGRRFRALKLWFVLRMYGRQGLQAYLRHHCALAASFARCVQGHPRFEVMAPPRLSLVCFALKGGSNEENAALLEAVNASGKAFLVHTDLGGRYTLRMAVGSAQTQARHVDAAWALICNLAEQLPCRGG